MSKVRERKAKEREKRTAMIYSGNIPDFNADKYCGYNVVYSVKWVYENGCEVEFVSADMKRSVEFGAEMASRFIMDRRLDSNAIFVDMYKWNNNAQEYESDYNYCIFDNEFVDDDKVACELGWLSRLYPSEYENEEWYIRNETEKDIEDAEEEEAKEEIRKQCEEEVKLLKSIQQDVIQEALDYFKEVQNGNNL